MVTVAPNDTLLEKLKSNLQEVRARGGQLYVFTDDDTHIKSESGVHVIRMPEHYGALSPILHVVPLPLLAYHTACARGTDVDKPRNLAKSVTVERGWVWDRPSGAAASALAQADPASKRKRLMPWRLSSLPRARRSLPARRAACDTLPAAAVISACRYSCSKWCSVSARASP